MKYRKPYIYTYSPDPLPRIECALIRKNFAALYPFFDQSRKVELTKEIYLELIQESIKKMGLQ
jgi:hypothetical protein